MSNVNKFSKMPIVTNRDMLTFFVSVFRVSYKRLLLNCYDCKKWVNMINFRVNIDQLAQGFCWSRTSDRVARLFFNDIKSIDLSLVWFPLLISYSFNFLITKAISPLTISRSQSSLSPSFNFHCFNILMGKTS